MLLNWVVLLPGPHVDVGPNAGLYSWMSTKTMLCHLAGCKLSRLQARLCDQVGHCCALLLSEITDWSFWSGGSSNYTSQLRVDSKLCGQVGSKSGLPGHLGLQVMLHY